MTMELAGLLECDQVTAFLGINEEHAITRDESLRHCYSVIRLVDVEPSESRCVASELWCGRRFATGAATNETP